MGKMASFFAGLGSGYLKADRQRSEDERQAKKDGQDAELFNARMDEINQAKKLNSDLSTASKPATFSENTPTLDTGDGARVYGMQGGADVAASDARQFTRMAPQAPAPTQGQAFAVNGTAVPDRATMQSTVKAYDEGANERIAQAYRANGKPMEAINMSNAVTQAKANSLGLETAQLKFADEKYNRDVVDKVDAHSDWSIGGAQLLTQTQVGSLKGVEVTRLISPDGKMVSFVSTGPDGPGQPLGTFENSLAGKRQFLERLRKAPIESKIAVMADHAKTAKADAAAQEQAARDERKVTAIEKNADTNSRKTDGMMMGLIGGGRGGSGGGGGQPGVPGVALKDRREYLSDFSQGLEDPKAAMTPAESTDIQQRNQTKLVQADAIFSTNAEFGNVLTAPQARAAMDLAQNPKNIRQVKDNNTGAVYEVVEVNGKQVVVGTGALKSKNTNEERVREGGKNPMQELFRMDEKKLMTMAKRPKGVSFAEAAEAQAELDKRKSGPPTLKAW